MNFHIVFKLQGKQHHERGFTEPQHAAEAMVNWERFGIDNTCEVTDGDRALVATHYLALQ